MTNLKTFSEEQLDEMIDNPFWTERVKREHKRRSLAADEYYAAKRARAQA